ncbi:hypothetical protein [Mesorhizobium sp. M1182]|uniref:hypothetical protein n=1 Tax=Mesorhizobium sp. M1182 TaxID=2957067 RepID=UPI003336AB54
MARGSTKSPERASTGATNSTPLLASLIRAEITHRQSRSINYRLSGAKFPVLKDLERNLILIGGTEPTT